MYAKLPTESSSWENTWLFNILPFLIQTTQSMTALFEFTVRVKATEPVIQTFHTLTTGRNLYQQDEAHRKLFSVLWL